MITSGPPCSSNIGRNWRSTNGKQWGFLTIMGTILGVPIIGTVVFWGLYWGPLFWGNYKINLSRLHPPYVREPPQGAKPAGALNAVF